MSQNLEVIGDVEIAFEFKGEREKVLLNIRASRLRVITEAGSCARMNSVT